MKKILLGITVVAIVTISAWNFQIASKNDNISEMTLQNIQALAEEVFPAGQKVQKITKTDLGRETIKIDGVWKTCDKIQNECSGDGGFTCPLGQIEYSNCKPAS